MASIDSYPVSDNNLCNPVLRMDGVATNWSSQSATGLFTVPNGNGVLTVNASCTIISDTLAYLRINTVGPGSVSITDSSSGATASFNVFSTLATPTPPTPPTPPTIFQTPYQLPVGGTIRNIALTVIDGVAITATCSGATITFHSGYSVSANDTRKTIAIMSGAGLAGPLLVQVTAANVGLNTWTLSAATGMSGSAISSASATDLQYWLDNANDADILILTAGATYIGNFTFPPVPITWVSGANYYAGQLVYDPNTSTQYWCYVNRLTNSTTPPNADTAYFTSVRGSNQPTNYRTGAKWVYVISSALANLPEKVRVNPSQIGSMATIQQFSDTSGDDWAAMFFDCNASYWRFCGIQVIAPGNCYNMIQCGYTLSGVTPLDGTKPPYPAPLYRIPAAGGTYLVNQLPQSIWFDRCWITAVNPPYTGLCSSDGAGNITITSINQTLASSCVQWAFFVGGLGYAINSFTNSTSIVLTSGSVTGVPSVGTNLPFIISPWARCGMQFNGATMAVFDSYVDNFKSTHYGGVEANAIFVFNGTGPYKIYNCFLEAAGENVIFGGTEPSITHATDPTNYPVANTGLIPSDIEVQYNYFYKRHAWNGGEPYGGNYWQPPDPASDGTGWFSKNNFELKNAARVLFNANIVDTNFGNNADGGQLSSGIVVTPRAQGTTAPWSGVSDANFTNNTIHDVGTGFRIAGSDTGSTTTQSMTAARIALNNNLFYNIRADYLTQAHGPGPVCLHITGGYNGTTTNILYPITDFLISHNTFMPAFSITATGTCNTSWNGSVTTITFMSGNAFIPAMNTFKISINGDGGHIIANATLGGPPISCTNYPTLHPTTLTTTDNLGTLTGATFSITYQNLNIGIYLEPSGGANCLLADRIAIKDNIFGYGVNGVETGGLASAGLTGMAEYFTNWTWTNNELVYRTTDSGYAASYAAFAADVGNTAPHLNFSQTDDPAHNSTGAPGNSDDANAGFTNYAGNNYVLTTKSVGYRKATDGKDCGCDIAALLAAQQLPGQQTFSMAAYVEQTGMVKRHNAAGNIKSVPAPIRIPYLITAAPAKSKPSSLPVPRTSNFSLNRASGLYQGLVAIALGQNPGSLLYQDSGPAQANGQLNGYSGAGNTPSARWKLDSSLERQVLYGNGGTDSVQFSVPLVPPNDFTVACWLQSNNNAVTAPILCQTVPAQTGRMSFQVGNNQLQLSISGGNVVVSALTLNINTWYHVAITRLAALYQLWINGNPNGASASNGTAIYQTLAQALGNIAAAQYLTGAIADLGVWSRALTAQELQPLADAGNIYMSGLILPNSQRRIQPVLEPPLIPLPKNVGILVGGGYAQNGVLPYTWSLASQQRIQ